MPEAVIVATARTPIGRASKGTLVEARPDDMSAFIIDQVLSKVPQLSRARSRTSSGAPASRVANRATTWPGWRPFWPVWTPRE